MDTEKKQHVTDYVTDFDPRAYMDAIYTPEKDDSGNTALNVPYLNNLNKAFIEGDIRGQRILDIGSGPCINSVLPAFQRFEEIYLSDLVPKNLTALKNWRSGNSANMLPVVEYFVQSEGITISSEELDELLRNKISGIFEIDVRRRDPLGDRQIPEVDAIVSSGCLESAATDYESFSNYVSNITPLLKQGGKLVLSTVLYRTSYGVGSKVFMTAYLTPEYIRHSLNLVAMTSYTKNSFRRRKRQPTVRHSYALLPKRLFDLNGNEEID
ncbi:hypothetical protein ScPMuIL_017346 [Solemya velum]